MSLAIKLMHASVLMKELLSSFYYIFWLVEMTVTFSSSYVSLSDMG
jgi:hypothetical protein